MPRFAETRFSIPLKVAAAALLGGAFSAAAVNAESAEEFYRGKQIRLIVGNAVGADYDLGARVLSRHMSRHMPGGPTILVQNMPGAASIGAANYVAGVGAKDGTLFGSVSRNLPAQAVIGREALRADPRGFRWIGSSGTNTVVCYVRRASAIRTADDLFTRDLIVGGIGSGSTQSIVPTALQRLLNMRFKVVEGYKGNADALVALERGEIDGLCSGFSPLRTTHASLLMEGHVRLLLHSGTVPLAEAPDIPSFHAFAKTDKQRRILKFLFSSDDFGRPYFAPPGIPGDRLSALRTAFAAALKDESLQADAAKMQLDMTYRSPEAIETFVQELYAMPAELIREIQEIAPSL
jgi:tripartite-type tricarboxylate transporter receptor subunit TctC